MSILVVLPVVLPMLAAALLLALPYHRLLHRAAGAGVAVTVAVWAVTALLRTRDGTVLVQHVGDWPAGIAVSLAVDTPAALMVAVTAVVTVACTAFAAAAGEDRHRLFVPLVLLMSAGGYGAFLAADLFNLFVLVEVMLVPSYALLALGGGRERIRAARVYVTVNLLASTLFLAGVALLYGTAGTVNLAELAGAAAASPEVAVAGGVVLVALSVKAAVVPMHGWLARSYPHASPAVTALFSGLLTKVGVFAIFRIGSVVYDGRIGPGWLWAAAAVATMVVGVFGALGQTGMRAVLTHHMVSQIGYLLVGLALFSVAGLGAAMFYLVQYIPVKTALFLCAGAVQATYGTDRLDRLGGLAARHRVLAVAFVAAALSLAGLPPFSGFVAKMVLLRAAAQDGEYLLFSVAVVVSLLTLLSMIKIGDGAFRGPPPSDAGPARRMRPALVAPAAALAALSLLLGLGAGPLLELTDAAGARLGDPSRYVAAVMAP